jgi:hypothetical protein
MEAEADQLHHLPHVVRFRRESERDRGGGRGGREGGRERERERERENRQRHHLALFLG